jgi:radical SAM superfamily enzyme YgiQ (UPF0313 family)
MFVGFESVSADSLAEARKFAGNVARYEELVRALHERGIMVNGSFVFGFDSEGPEVFRATVDWADDARIDTATFHILTPYPGTELFRDLESQGRIIDRNPDHYDTTHAVFQPARMSARELEAGYRRAKRRFYRTGNLARRILRDRAGIFGRAAVSVGYKKKGFTWPLMMKAKLVPTLFRAAVWALRRSRVLYDRKLAGRRRCGIGRAMGELRPASTSLGPIVPCGPDRAKPSPDGGGKGWRRNLVPLGGGVSIYTQRG